jgi:hypothetical protein
MPQAPLTVRLAGTVQAAEALILLAATVLVAVDTAAGRSYQAASGVALTVIGLGTVAVLLLIAVSLARARPWTRTPALLTQLFTGIVGFYLVQGGRLGWGIPALALAVAGFAGLLAPASLRVLTRGHPEEPPRPAPAAARPAPPAARPPRSGAKRPSASGRKRR